MGSFKPFGRPLGVNIFSQQKTSLNFFNNPNVRENSKQRDLEKYEARRGEKNCGGAKWTSGSLLYPAIFVRLKLCIGVF